MASFTPEQLNKFKIDYDNGMYVDSPVADSIRQKIAVQGNSNQQPMQPQQAPERTLSGTVQDIGTSIARGVLGAGESVLGLADIATGGHAGKFLEDKAGYSIGDLSNELSDNYSPAQQAVNKKVENADGFLSTLGTAVQNPSSIAGAIIESMPSMVAGGILGRGLVAAGSRLAPTAARTLGPRTLSMLGGAAGEGTIQAGAMAEQVRNQNADGLLTGGQIAKSIASGIGTGAFSLIGGKIAKKFGFADADTFFAGGGLAAKSERNVISRIIGGGISEGVFEELPQSIQEQVWMNSATGKPLTEGVGESGAMGMLAGIGMGAGTNIKTGTDTVKPPPKDIPTNLDLPAQLKTIEDKIARVSDLDMSLASAKELENLYKQADVIQNKIKPGSVTTPEKQQIRDDIEFKENLIFKDLDLSLAAKLNNDTVEKSPQLDKLTVLNNQITELNKIEDPTVGQVHDLDMLEDQYSALSQEYKNEAFSTYQNDYADRQSMYNNLFSDENIQAVNADGIAAEAAKDLNYVPKSGRPTDIITQKGVPYQRREYLENMLSGMQNKDDYEIVEVSTPQFTKNLLAANQQKQELLQEELNAVTTQEEKHRILQDLEALDVENQNLVLAQDNLEFEAFDAEYPEQVGYVARLTDEAIDNKRPEVIAEQEAQNQINEKQDFVDTEESIRKQQNINKMRMHYEKIKSDIATVNKENAKRVKNKVTLNAKDQAAQNVYLKEKQAVLDSLDNVFAKIMPKNKVYAAAQKTQTLIDKLNAGTFTPLDQKSITAAMNELKEEYRLLALEEKKTPESNNVTGPKNVKRAADILTKQKQIVALNRQVKELEKTPDLTNREEVEAKIAVIEPTSKPTKKQKLQLKKYQLQLKKDDARQAKIVEINNQMAVIFTDTDRAMAGRFQNDFSINRGTTEDGVTTETPGMPLNVRQSTAIPTKDDVDVTTVDPTIPEDVETSRSKSEQDLDTKETSQAAPVIMPTTPDQTSIPVEDTPVGNDPINQQQVEDDLFNLLNDTNNEEGEITRRDFIKQGVGILAWASIGLNTKTALASQDGFVSELNKKEQSAEGLLSWIATNSSNPNFQKLAKDLIELLPDTDNISLNVSDVAMTSSGTTKVDRKNGKIAINIYGNGQKESTFLHEIIHATIISRYDMLNYYMANPGKFGSHNADKALEQYKKVWKEFRSGVMNYARNSKLKISELPLWMSQPYSDPDEFITYALTHPELQKFLGSNEYQGKTLRERFKDAIRKIWDFFSDKKNPTWLDAAMVTSDDLLQAMKLDKPDFKVATQLLEMSQDTTNNNLNEVSNELVEPISFDQTEPTQAEYDRIFNQKKNLWTRAKQIVRMSKADSKLLADKLFGSISTRLKLINPMLAAKARELDYRTGQETKLRMEAVIPLLEKAKKMTPQDKSAWNWARIQGATNKLNQLNTKYGMTAEYAASRKMLDDTYKAGVDVGFDMGNIAEYWPRVMKDQEGFLQKTQGTSQRPEFTDALQAQADKMGITVEALDPNMRADIISNLILGVHAGIGGPGNTQARVFDQVPEEFAEFYMDSDAAMMQYIYGMTKKIEARRFFGKVPAKINKAKQKLRNDTTRLRNYQDLLKANPNDEQVATKVQNISDDIKLMNNIIESYKHQRDFTENIGGYIDELLATNQIQPSDERTVREILDARFHEQGTRGIVNAYKNLAYIDTMGSPISALTQIGDLAYAYYIGGLTPTGIMRTTKNVMKAAMKQSEITKEDLGVSRMAQEFADSDSLSNAVSKVFKAVGLEQMDSIGKEALINTSLANYKDKANQNPGKLKKEINHIFGSDSGQVVTDLIGGNITDNVKLLVYNRLLDFQPVALSEMPEKYLNSGNGRIFYMLKTYTLKQMDVFRREVIHNMRSGDKALIMEGVGNMAKITMMLTLANAGADELKDFVLGKDVKFKDNVIENFLTLGGASRYTKMQVRNEGIGSAYLEQILPPMKFVNSISKDVTGDVSDGLRVTDSIPIGGKLYYWHFGRGADKRTSVNEKEFKDIKKDVAKFKEQLKNKIDKKTFLMDNIDKVRAMKKVDHYQGILNKNTALTNKLKDMKQTPNVRKRISQLQQRKEMILESFFKTQN